MGWKTYDSTIPRRDGRGCLARGAPSNRVAKLRTLC